jgi:hypothetical protein
MKGKVGVVERPTVVMCRGLGGKGHVPLSSRPEPTIIQAKLSPVLNGCSERAEVRTGPTKNKRWKMWHLKFITPAFAPESIKSCPVPRTSMSNRLRRHSSAAVEIWNIVWTARTGEKLEMAELANLTATTSWPADEE